MSMRCGLSMAVLLMMLAVGCGNSGNTPVCRSTGDACAYTSDCCGQLVCQGGRCTWPAASCPAEAPIDCGDAIPGACCESDVPYCCAADGRCHATATDCGGGGGTSCDGKACVSSSGCCSGYTCSRFNPRCVKASNLKMGEPCTLDGQCASGMCRGWCTEWCSDDDDCKAGIGVCVETSSGSFLCFPWCGSGGNTACSVYGAGTTCQAATSIDGASTRVCAK